MMVRMLALVAIVGLCAGPAWARPTANANCYVNGAQVEVVLQDECPAPVVPTVVIEAPTQNCRKTKTYKNGVTIGDHCVLPLAIPGVHVILP